MAVGLAYCKIILTIVGKSPGLSAIAVAKKRSPVAGNLLGVVLAVFFLLLSFTYLRDFLELINIHLFETPREVIALIMLLLGVYALKQGLEVFARISALLLIPTLLLIMLGLTPNIFHMEFMPVITHLESWKFITRGAIMQFGNFGELLVLVIILPFVKKSKNTGMSVYGPVLFTGLLIAVLTFVLYGVFSARAPLITYKLYQLFRFMGRLDSLFIALWMMVFFIKVHLFLYAGLKSLSDTLGLKSHQPLILPAAMAVVFLSLVSFGSYVEFLSFFMRIFPMAALPVEIGALLTLFITVSGEAGLKSTGEKA